MGCSTLWQAHLPVSAAAGATGLPGFAWKMAVKTVCVCLTLLVGETGKASSLQKFAAAIP